MSNSSEPPEGFPDELQLLLQSLEQDKRAQVEALFETAISATRKQKITDLWEQPELASSFWVLLISGVNHQRELKIAQTLLTWKAFFVKDSASVLCLQSSERQAFRCCTKHANVRGCPTLLLSDSPELNQYIRFDPQFLLAIADDHDALHRLFTLVHDELEKVTSVSDLLTVLKEDQIWQDLQVPKAEIKHHICASNPVEDGFDVFLSHNSKDKPAVIRLAEALRSRGLRVWLDQWELIPGRPWQKAIEDIVERVPAAIVVVGQDGLGPWEIPEMRGCISHFVEREMPVIPVILPGVRELPKLPLFLRQFTWVDLRDGLTRENLDRLHWGITGASGDAQRSESDEGGQYGHPHHAGPQ